VGIVVAFMTAFYTFRMILITFHGKAHTQAHAGKGLAHHVPLIVLAVLSTFIGAWIHPPLSQVLPGGEGGEPNHALQLTLEIMASVVAVVGVGIAAGLFLGSRERIARLAGTPAGDAVRRFWLHAFGFDWLYDHLFVRPYRGLARLHRTDWVNGTVNLAPALSMALHGRLSATQNGQLRWYALVVFGAASAMLLLLLVR
ncbi:MAG: NADH-quinone oxidoreductase subunit L, partial [Salinisphaera sp.]|nr:NADH-quinone oxidoreductase subunit L [Salinisphaera sp.]